MEALAQALARVLTPASLALAPTFDGGAAEEAQRPEGLPLPGDLVLLSTAGVVYGLGRQLTDQRFDHAVVVLERGRALHVSPPTIRTLSVGTVMQQERGPLVLRPRLQPAERSAFLETLEGLVGKPYSLLRFFWTLADLTLRSKLSQPMPERSADLVRLFEEYQAADGGDKAWICTDAILVALRQASPAFRKVLDQDNPELRDSSVAAIERLSRVEPKLLPEVQQVVGLESERERCIAEACEMGLREFCFVSGTRQHGQKKQQQQEEDARAAQASLGRFGVLGRLLEVLQAAMGVLVSQGDQVALYTLWAKARNALSQVVDLDEAWEVASGNRGSKSAFAYLVLFLLLMGRAHLVWAAFVRVLQLLVVRRAMVYAWDEIMSNSKL